MLTDRRKAKIPESLLNSTQHGLFPTEVVIYLLFLYSIFKKSFRSGEHVVYSIRSISFRVLSWIQNKFTQSWQRSIQRISLPLILFNQRAANSSGIKSLVIFVGHVMVFVISLLLRQVLFLGPSRPFWVLASLI